MIGTVVLLLGRPVAAAILRAWNSELRTHTVSWLVEQDSLPWLSAATGAYIGTFSHVVLDSLMHADMRPWAPLSDANALLAAISLPLLHLACIAAGIGGLLLWLGRRAIKRRGQRAED